MMDVDGGAALLPGLKNVVAEVWSAPCNMRALVRLGCAASGLGPAIFKARAEDNGQGWLSAGRGTVLGLSTEQLLTNGDVLCFRGTYIPYVNFLLHAFVPYECTQMTAPMYDFIFALLLSPAWLCCGASVFLTPLPQETTRTLRSSPTGSVLFSRLACLHACTRTKLK